MKYKLLQNGRGVLIDPSPIMTDIKDGATLSFLLPGDGVYCAVFVSSAGVRTQVQIQKNGECKLHRDLFGKRQYFDLFVVELNKDGAVVQEWTCEPLLVSSLRLALKTQWQISGGMTDEGAIKRLTELEVENAARKDENERLTQRLNELEEAVNKRIRRVIP